MNLLLLDPSEPDDRGLVTLADGRATHLVEVVKVTPGRTVRVGLIDGPIGRAVVTALAGQRVTLQCTFARTIPPRPSVDLLLALPRPKVMRRLWAQLAALGVGRIILTNAERVERPYFDTHVLSPECYRPLLVEGLQQARDTRLPVVSIHRRFRTLVEDELDTLVPGARRLVADPGGTAAIGDAAQGADRVLVAVGPEGGWNAFELDLLSAHGFQPISLGPRTLRTDTACVALLALTHAAMPGRGV
ncbi:MAG TPA: RsmE family RNA methyltransferase [Vicinamibacterales bacterium]|nr:RsmE family RNA methyltransferase [Vicinamibacterales bacterium]